MRNRGDRLVRSIAVARVHFITLISFFALVTCSTSTYGQATANAGECVGVLNGGSSCGAGGKSAGKTGSSPGAVNGLSLQLAQQWNLKASLCQNPAGAACARSYAAWYSCMAYNYNNGSCGIRPTCIITSSASGTGGFIPSSSGTTKADQINTLVNLGVSFFNLFHKDAADLQPDDTNDEPDPDPAAEAAARQAQLNTEAAALLQNTENVLASLNPGGSNSAAPNSASTLNALLNNGPSFNASNTAINNLLGGPPAPAAGTPDSRNTPDPNATNNAITSLLGNSANGASGSSSGLLPATVPQNLLPPDPQINSALQDSTDNPDSNQTSSLDQMFQSATQQFKDGLNGLITSSKTLASGLMNDPVVQWATSDQGTLTTVPLPQTGDTAQIATDKVFAQAVVGFNEFTEKLAHGEPVDFVEGVISFGPIGFARALHNYQTKMVNQIGADLGLANDTIFGTPPGFEGSQEGSH